jgi:phosphoserine phosphatase
MLMAGDGATDLQAKPPAAAVVGFGGVAVREKVQALLADWFVPDFDDLISIADKYCNKKKKSSKKDPEA